MHSLASIDVTTNGDRRDRVHRACLAVGGSVEASARWEAEVRALCTSAQSSASNLAAVGDPVEFQFVWSVADGKVDRRVTADPAPDSSPGVRLAQCLLLAPSLLPDQVPYRERLLRDQDEHGCRYGGWISSRCRGASFGRKLYMEIPAGVAWRDWSSVGPDGLDRLPVRGLVPIMAGLDPARAGIELYGEMAPMSSDALALMCGQFALPPLSREAIGLLEALMQQRIGAQMPAAEQGLSLAMDDKRQVISMTWYAHADALLGSAWQTRQALLALGSARGWSMSEYTALSAADEQGAVPWHGVIGVTITRDAGLLFSATCSTRAEEAP